MAEKALLRYQYLYKRNLLTDDEQAEFNMQIAEKLKDLLQNLSVSTVHTFLPQSGKREIDTWRIVEIIRTDFPEIRLVAPSIIPGTKRMNHYLLTPETKLLLNRWLIPEPDPNTSELVVAKKIDAVLIPLLAFDQNGFRVGYGGGYYDRFLAECRPDILKIGLSYFEPVDYIEDKDQYDIPMDICITPSKVIRW
ncbi:5-formyltetrahydrofolate cyclo-ligase [Dyadobacter psychrotolerans]|uniref:5-formyltetrahydrofolate cyclo-ligase n=1 Tax=Dyadobacter psychrotolerans TaxID=2541721 RepID=A0A4V2Z3S6_9BACT|nr:5-formyltetrahydrofolate cyclo-ligase [Dyadobacter psychrotolerans]TDE13878.1 5-formyltetrahydrofolate cyclo-ligase [Dyadobacter psychrotolerans]